MKRLHKQYIIIFTIFLVILSLATYLLSQYLPEGYYHPHSPFVLMFFSIYGFVSHRFLLRSAAKGKQFTNTFMASTSIKMLFSLFSIATYMMIVKENLKVFAIWVLAYYVIITVFETAVLLKQLKDEELVSLYTESLKSKDKKVK